MRNLVFAAAALALGACSPLTSEHPLFTAADQSGPAPLTEGVWVVLNSRCTREAAAMTPMPDDCDPFTLRRLADGSWELTDSKVVNGAEQREIMHAIIVPAVPRANADAYAPLYVAQVPAREADEHSDASDEQRVYGAIAPIGGLPAREAFFIDLECEAVLREGDIGGITAERDDQGVPKTCVATSQAAVREAARRGAIEQLGGVDENRMILVRP